MVKDVRRRAKLKRKFIIIGIVFILVSAIPLFTVLGHADAKTALHPFDGYIELATWVSEYQPIRNDYCYPVALDMFQNGIDHGYIVSLQITGCIATDATTTMIGHELIAAYVRMGDGMIHVYTVDPQTRKIFSQMWGINWVMGQ
jgi:hypothetical protein